MNGRRIWSRDCGRTGRCAGEAGGAGHARQEELFRGLLFVKAVVSRLVRAGLWVFFAMFALVVARIGLLEDRAFDMPFAWALLAVAFAAAAAALLGRLRTTKCLVMRRQRRWILAAVLLLAFVWQCILGWKLRCSPAGTPPIYIELKSLHESALAVLRGEGLPDRLYFATYPHQFPLFLLLTAYYAVIQAVLGYVPASSGLLLNLVFIDLGVLFLLLLTKELRGERRMMLVAAACVLFIPFYTYIPFFYSDTLAIPFVTGPLWLYVRAERMAGRGRRTLCYLACGALFALGAQLRATVWIPFAAVLIHLFVANAGRLRRLLRPLACLLLAAAAIAGGYRFWESRQNLVSQQELEANRLPKLHWVMMSTGSYEYRQADFDFTMGSGTFEEKQAAVKQELLRRLQARGFGGTLQYLWEKATYQWGDGLYRCEVYLSRSPREPTSSLPHQFVLQTGRHYRLFYGYGQVYHIAVLLLTLLGLWGWLRKRADGPMMVVYLTIAGVFLFFLWWEAKPKYLLSFMPLLLLAATDGLRWLADRLCAQRGRERGVAAPSGEAGDQ